MGKIIKFPTPKEIQEKEEQKAYDEVSYFSDEAIHSAQFLMECMEELIRNGTVSPEIKDMMLRDETQQECRDMYVVVNMLFGMFNRYFGVPHELHSDMNNLYIKIKKLEKIHQETKDREEGWIEFVPDFDLDDPDDTN